ncbi:MAG: diacylglycerol kinase family protein [Clostridia bacterium]|nr:diacylglycerol kinase family protein [Clostridia bacterium]
MKTLIFYNPLSGNGGGDAKANELKATRLGEVEVLDVTKVDDLADMVGELCEDDAIIICGGDGTLCRFVNLVDCDSLKCDVLYAAVGSGNDFLRDAEKTVDDAPFSIKKHISELPVVTVNGESYRFINGVGYGIDGYCCEEGDRLKREKPSEAVNYTSVAIGGLLGKFKPKNAKVTVDGVEYSYKKVWLAPTMHGRFYGGGMMCAPAQDRFCEDGKNTLVVWHCSGALRTLMAFPSIFKGEHVNKKKMIAIHTGHEITVEFDAPCALQIDGETIVGVTSYSVSAKVTAPVK